MDEQQKQMILQYFGEQVNKMNNNPHQFTEWIMNYFLKTKEEQNLEIIKWLDERKVRNTEMINNLESQKILSSNNLDSENDLIDNIKLNL